MPSSGVTLIVIRTGVAVSTVRTPIQNITYGPVFHQATQPIRARIPLQPQAQYRAGRCFSELKSGTGNISGPCRAGSGQGANGAPIQNIVIGAFFKQAPEPIRMTFPSLHPRAGRIGLNTGAPVLNPSTGPPIHSGLARSRVPKTAPRGRTYSNAGAPVTGFTYGPVISSELARVRIPKTAPRGRVWANQGTPAQNITYGPVISSGSIRSRVPQVRRGRLYGNPGIPVPVPAAFPAPFYPLNHPAQARRPLPSRGRVSFNAGAPVQNVTYGPVFQQAVRPARAPVPQNRQNTGERINFLAGAPVQDTTAGPAIHVASVRARVPKTAPRGRTYGNAGAPVQNPAQGPAIRSFLACARVPKNAPRGRVYGNTGAPVQNVTFGPSFVQVTRVRPQRLPLPNRGRIDSNPGIPVLSLPVPTIGPAFYPRHDPARVRITQPPRGRIYRNSGAAIQNIVAGPVIHTFEDRVRLRQNAPRGRVYSNPGAPVQDITSGPPISSGLARVRIPKNAPRGRVWSNRGAAVRNTTAGPIINSLLARVRIPKNAPRGRDWTTPRGIVLNPSAGPVFAQAVRAIQARRPLPPRGRAYGNKLGTFVKTESGPLHIYLPGGCVHRGDLHITLPPCKVSLQGHIGAFGSLNIVIPALKTSLTGKDQYGRLKIVIPPLVTGLAGKNYHSQLKIVIPPPQVAITGKTVHDGPLNISLGQCLLGMFRPLMLRLPPEEPAADYITGTPNTRWTALQPWKAWYAGMSVNVSISHLSTQYVLVPIKATKNGTAYNPTSDTVQFAFAPTPTYVPQTGDWVSGSWITSTGNPIYPYSAQCLVGPGATVLGIGTYTIYVKISDSPETPVLIAGQLEIT